MAKELSLLKKREIANIFVTLENNKKRILKCIYVFIVAGLIALFIYTNYERIENSLIGDLSIFYIFVFPFLFFPALVAGSSLIFIIVFFIGNIKLKKRYNVLIKNYDLSNYSLDYVKDLVAGCEGNTTVLTDLVKNETYSEQIVIKVRKAIRSNIIMIIVFSISLVVSGSLLFYSRYNESLFGMDAEILGLFGIVFSIVLVIFIIKSKNDIEVLKKEYGLTGRNLLFEEAGIDPDTGFKLYKLVTDNNTSIDKK